MQCAWIYIYIHVCVCAIQYIYIYDVYKYKHMIRLSWAIHRVRFRKFDRDGSGDIDNHEMAKLVQDHPSHWVSFKKNGISWDIMFYLLGAEHMRWYFHVIYIYTLFKYFVLVSDNTKEKIGRHHVHRKNHLFHGHLGRFPGADQSSISLIAISRHDIIIPLWSAMGISLQMSH